MMRQWKLLNIWQEPRALSVPLKVPHAVAHVRKIAPAMNKDDIIIICLSGRGDKDVAAIARYRGVNIHE